MGARGRVGRLAAGGIACTGVEEGCAQTALGLRLPAAWCEARTPHHLRSVSARAPSRAPLVTDARGAVPPALPVRLTPRVTQFTRWKPVKRGMLEFSVYLTTVV